MAGKGVLQVPHMHRITEQSYNGERQSQLRLSKAMPGVEGRSFWEVFQITACGTGERLSHLNGQARQKR